MHVVYFIKDVVTHFGPVTGAVALIVALCFTRSRWFALEAWWTAAFGVGFLCWLSVFWSYYYGGGVGGWIDWVITYVPIWLATIPVLILYPWRARYTVRSLCLLMAHVSLLSAAVMFLARDHMIEMHWKRMGINVEASGGVVKKMYFFDPVVFELNMVLAQPELETLSARNCRLTDDDIERIAAHCPKLTTVYFSSNPIGDRGAQALARLSDLRYISLHRTEVSDAALEALAQCRRLRGLDVTGTAVTRKGVERFKEGRPRVEIEPRA